MRGYGYNPHFVEGDDPATMHQLMAETLEAVVNDIRRIQDGRAAQRFLQAPRLADDRHAHAEGLDLSQGDRRQAGRGLLALAPGADERDARPSRARPHPRDVDEELPAGGAVRRNRPPRAGACGASAAGEPPDERQSARQRRRAAARPQAAGFPRLCRRSSRARRCDRRGDAGHGRIPARRDEAQSRSAQLPPVQPGREQFQPLAGRARGHEPRLGRRDLLLTTTISRPTAG